MGFLKRCAPIILILGSVLAGIFLIGRKSQTPSIKTLSYETAADQSFYELGSAANQTETLESLGIALGSAPLTDPSFNFTQNIAKKIVSELRAKNNQNPALFASGELNAIRPDELVTDFLAEELENIDYQKFIPEISYQGLKISPAGEKANLEKYLRDSQIIIRRNLTGLGITQNLFSETDISKIIRALNRTIEELKNLETPRKLMTLHAREINLLTAERNIFESINNYTQDPLNAFMAFQSLGLITDEFKKLSREFQEFARTNNLAF